ncbi:unnamed protein product, partial [Mesorhabditis belari]|uniref:Uncharacterized protein n=1 Tax=Mesorhabditis belari TaxID=2138241 RepID=A0AAF3FJ72_9BILA
MLLQAIQLGLRQSPLLQAVPLLVQRLRQLIQPHLAQDQKLMTLKLIIFGLRKLLTTKASTILITPTILKTLATLAHLPRMMLQGVPTHCQLLQLLQVQQQHQIRQPPQCKKDAITKNWTLKSELKP